MEFSDELRNTIVVKKKEPDRTRDLVARAILERGPASAVELAERLSITPAGIRRHLDSLIAEGVLEPREAHLSSVNVRGRGRPAKVFVMTDGGREKFEHSYDDLAVSALKFMSSASNGELVQGFAKSRAAEFERLSSQTITRKNSIAEKAIALSDYLCEEGYSSTTNTNTHGVEICQHHCPVAHVAAEFPQLCDAETEIFSKILGTHVQRLATIANGDGVCTTFVPVVHQSNKSVKAKSVKRGA